LRLFWDGAAIPSVEAPLGDFFCNGLRRVAFEALSMAVVDRKYICRLPMPFRRGAIGRLQNDGPVPVQVTVFHSVSEIAAGGPDVNYLHASWRSALSRGIPFTVADIPGDGHYVGCYLICVGTDGGWNILESDDMMWVDDDARPTLHGTGLEDHFNGGWYYLRGLYDLPLHGMIEKAPVRTSQYRFCLSDRIKFSGRLRLAFEFGHGNQARGYMSGTAWWYQPEPRPSGSELLLPAERQPPPDPLEPHSIMCSLLELERVKAYGEAMARCFEYTQRYPASPHNEMLRLRALAYRERTVGVESVVAGYRRIAETGGLGASTQAKDLLWFHQNPRHALLLTSMRIKGRVFLDGKEVIQHDGTSIDIESARVVLEPGEHIITA